MGNEGREVGPIAEGLLCHAKLFTFYFVILQESVNGFEQMILAFQKGYSGTMGSLDGGMLVSQVVKGSVRRVL